MQDFLVAYPESKVILTVRDDEHEWYLSALQTIFLFHPKLQPFSLQLYLSLFPVGWVTDKLFKFTFLSLFDDPTDAELTKAVYRRHINEVKSTVLPDRLLIFNVKDGWKPLCLFLNVSCPSAEPFPHLNEKKEMESMIFTGQIVGCLTLAVLLFVLFYIFRFLVKRLEGPSGKKLS